MCWHDLYSVVGCEYNANESTIRVKLSLKRKTQKIKIYIDQLGKKNSQRSHEPNLVFPLGAAVLALAKSVFREFVEQYSHE